MTIYASVQRVTDDLERAQALIECHLETGASGRCRGCDEPEPCNSRMRAYGVFATYGALPMRRASATKAGLRQVR